MPPWTLPGCENDPVMRYKAILETSFAFSRTFNPRNIEHHWYSLWAQTLSDLVADIPNLLVAPQFPVWFVPQDEDENDGDDPAMVIELGPEALQRQDDSDGEEEGDGAGNTSMTSTVPEERTKSVIVDFVMIHLTAVAHPQPEIPYRGWRITTASVGLLVEVKRFTSRSLQGREQDEGIYRRISEAQADLLNQATHLFVENPNKDSVLAIAAAGPFWCSTTICRTNVGRRIHMLSAKDPSYQAPDEQHLDEDPDWDGVLRVDLADSIDRLHRIYTTLEGMGILEVPANI